MLPPKIKKQIYNGLVLYCSTWITVWSSGRRFERIELEQVQNYGRRLILAKSPRTPSEQELGLRTLEDRRSLNRLNLTHRCVIGQAPASLCQRIDINTRRNTRGQ